MKICTKCHKEYPATIEYFYAEKRVKSGLQVKCRLCIKEYRHNRREQMKEYHHKTKEKQNAQRRIRRRTIKGCLRSRWNDMNKRCNNPNSLRYEDYGGRGIENKFKPSDEFIDYVINELQTDPRELQIDRINNDGHYEKGNIRFITAKENCKNRRQRR